MSTRRVRRRGDPGHTGQSKASSSRKPASGGSLRYLVYRNKNLTIRRVPGKKKKPSPLTTPPTELWPGKRSTHEDLTDFFRRVWKPYLPLGLTLTHIREIDHKLYNAIRSYSASHGEAWPTDIAIPTEKSRLASAVERLNEVGPGVLSPRELIAVGRKLTRQCKPSP